MFFRIATTLNIKKALFEGGLLFKGRPDRNFQRVPKGQ